MLTRAWLADAHGCTSTADPLDDPAVSPLFADLAGLPPILIQVGTREISSSAMPERLAKRGRARPASDIELDALRGHVGHEFQLHAAPTRRRPTEAIAAWRTFVREYAERYSPSRRSGDALERLGEQHLLGEDQVGAVVVGHLVLVAHRDRVERAGDLAVAAEDAAARG